MEINIDEENNKKINKLKEDKGSDDYEAFYNKEKYKISLINVDSSYRDQSPKNIYSTNVSYLPNNPLTFTKGSNIIKINYPNHQLTKGANIIVQNVVPISFVTSSSMYFFQNSSYLYLKIPHTVNLDYLKLFNKLQIQIDIANGSTLDGTYFYGNMPLNSILGVFDVNLPSVINKTDEINANILKFFNVKTAVDLDSQFLLIKLPFSYFSNEGQEYEITDFYKITYLDIYGIPVNGINADYPINYQKLQGFQTVYQVIDNNIFSISTSYNCIYSGVSGGSKIQIMNILNTIEGYPDANNYTLRLKKTFNNVVRVDLVSTEFTYVDYLIKSSGPNKNNSIYWKQLDDGNTVYSAQINEGNYDGSNLITTLTAAMNLVPRINSSVERPLYNNFNINFNSYTQEIVFSGFKTDNLPNSLKADIVVISNTNYFRLTIKHPNNLVQKNDLIIITNSVDLGVISRLNINKSLTVYEVLKEISSYTVLLGPVNQITTSTDLLTTLTDDGGGAVQVTSAARVSLLFSYPDTCGSVLGFKNVGFPNAITPFKTTISNLESYQTDCNLNSVGNVNTSSRLLNFAGQSNYFLLYVNDWELVINTSTLNACFAKILLSGQPGDVLYNSFINHPLEFDLPLSSLNELKIRITYSDGTLPDFRNIDNSFTLRITELITYQRNSGLNSKQTSYLQTMKEINYDKSS